MAGNRKKSKKPQGPKIFPIVRNVMINSHNFEKRLDRGDTVNCYFCGYPFKLTPKTVHIAVDGMQTVDCPKCKSHVAVLYYFDQVEKRKKQSAEPKKRRGRPRKTPEREVSM